MGGAQICISGQNRYPIVGLEWYLILSNGTLDWHGILLLDGSYWLEYGMVLRLFILGSWLLMVAAGCCYGYAHRLMDGLDCCWCCVASVAALHAVCLQLVVAWYPLVVWSCGSVSGCWLLFFLLSLVVLFLLLRMYVGVVVSRCARAIIDNGMFVFSHHDQQLPMSRPLPMTKGHRSNKKDTKRP